MYNNDYHSALNQTYCFCISFFFCERADNVIAFDDQEICDVRNCKIFANTNKTYIFLYNKKRFIIAFCGDKK